MKFATRFVNEYLLVNVSFVKYTLMRTKNKFFICNYNIYCPIWKKICLNISLYNATESD